MKKLFFLSIIILIFSCVEKKSDKSQVNNSEIKKSESQLANNKSNRKVTPTSETEMVYFEGGTYLMGSENGLSNEKPIHKVIVGAFKIDKSPVTVAQFRVFVEA